MVPTLISAKDTKVYQCTDPKCNKTFAYKTSWLNHIRLHTGERPYKCRICQRGFITNENRLYHERHTHMEKKELKCNECNNSFVNKKYLNMHYCTKP